MSLIENIERRIWNRLNRKFKKPQATIDVSVVSKPGTVRRLRVFARADAPGGHYDGLHDALLEDCMQKLIREAYKAGAIETHSYKQEPICDGMTMSAMMCVVVDDVS